MPLFWDWFWHIFGLILVMLFGLPSFMIRRIIKKYSLHQTLERSQLDRALYRDRPLSDADIDEVLSGFNSANFLRKRDVPVRYQEPGIQLVMNDGVTVYQLYPHAGEVDIRRVRKGKTVIYQVRSEILAAWFRAQAGEAGAEG